MLGESLLTLAALAGQMVVDAATSDGWEKAERGYAQLLGRGDAKQAKLARRWLEETREQLSRGAGADFSERDRGLLALLRPHLHEAYRAAERRRRGAPELTRRQRELLHLVADGYTNAQIGRRLGLAEGTVRKHLENIFARLQVSSRTAAVIRAFPDLTT